MKQSNVTIGTLKALHKATKTSESGKKMYTDEFRGMVVNFHYKSGMSLNSISDQTGIHHSNICKWKRALGVDQTAFIHGTKMRADVRTKCLAVREVVDYNKSLDETAIKYGVSVQSINTWIKKFEHDYTHLIDAPDGIPYLIKEKKMVFGRTNIEKIRAILQSQANELLALIDTMHMSGKQAEAMRKCAEETLAKEPELAEAAKTLEENGIDLK